MFSFVQLRRLAGTLLLMTTTAAQAELLTLAIDSDASTLSLSMAFRNVFGDLLPLTEQAPGSLTAHFTGTALVELDGGSITLRHIHATAMTQPGPFLPGPTLIDSHVPSPASLAGKVVNPDPTHPGFYAVRDLSIQSVSAALPLDSDGRFNATGLLMVIGSTRSVVTGPVGGRSETPQVVNNTHPSLGVFRQVGSGFELELPVRVAWQAGVPTSADLLPQPGMLQGRIVARVAIPEIGTGILTALGLGIAWTGWRWRAKRMEATLTGDAAPVLRWCSCPPRIVKRSIIGGLCNIRLETPTPLRCQFKRLFDGFRWRMGGIR